jgi:predicted SnoaL-like aldol condensation-catalyzing enzyme
MKRIVCIAIATAFVAGAAALAIAQSAQHTPQEQANLKAVLELYEKALNQHDFEGSTQYLGPRYVQHNPFAEDGPEGLKKFIEWRKQNLPNAKSVIKRAFADGDYVILHVHSIREPGTRGVAIVDIYKMENGKVVEHWDVIQEVPEDSKTKNKNGMF